ncbi:MAG: hypothetical protein HC913_20200 [Microscillaceae bacterium]|nr:hypothetical protein [Microscillaceae bacterium]
MHLIQDVVLSVDDHAIGLMDKIDFWIGQNGRNPGGLNGSQRGRIFC